MLQPRNEGNLYNWVGYLKGPPDTPYENGVFVIDIQIPEQYPLQPPVVRFETTIFHPNVHFKVTSSV